MVELWQGWGQRDGRHGGSLGIPTGPGLKRPVQEGWTPVKATQQAGDLTAGPGLGLLSEGANSVLLGIPGTWLQR